MLSRKLLEAAGNAGGQSLYVDDVFSTYLYTGNSSTQTITNGIDFSSDGGLVWLKNRTNSGTNNVLLDTERGGGKFLYSNTADTELDFTGVYGVTFNNNGFTLLDTTSAGYNTSSQKAVSWSFRKAKNFFDVVTYTGNGTAGRTVSHNLGSVPGCVIVKSLGANNWQVYHNGLTSAAYSIWLNSTSAEVSSTVWNSTAPTSTVFTVGSSGLVNNSGTSYVAYLFASDAGGFGDDEDESIIKCGSYTGTGAAGNYVTLGFEPQWIMLKAADRTQDWFMFDVMRGMTAVGGIEEYLQANSSGAGGSGGFGINVTSTGVCINNAGTSFNASGENYIYMAIRRPMKTPESGTEVFELLTRTGDSAYPIITTGITVDMILTLCRSNVANKSIYDRLRGHAKRLQTSTTAAETTETLSAIGLAGFDHNDGFDLGPDQGAGTINFSPRTYVYSMFKRATGFMDVVAYTGDGTSRNYNHSLGVTPELMIVKRRSATEDWAVYSSALGATYGLYLNYSDAASETSGFWDDIEPTSTQFHVRGTTLTGASGSTYIAYLFATLAGVSKVGSYTGTGADLNVDCGFSAGARFILIKRTDSTGDWYVWDSARGIVAGNDPYLTLNSTPAEVTSTDYIDPLSSGFTVTSSAPAGLNASGGTYIFYSIA